MSEAWFDIKNEQWKFNEPHTTCGCGECIKWRRQIGNDSCRECIKQRALHHVNSCDCVLCRTFWDCSKAFYLVEHKGRPAVPRTVDSSVRHSVHGVMI